MNKFTDKKTLKILLGIVLGFFVYFLLITLLVRVEEGSTQASITNYRDAIWYSIVTLTTVGYGDLVPATEYGRYIAFIFVLISMGIYGVLIGQFSSLISTIKENRKLGYNGTTMEDHAVIIGWNEFGKLVLNQLIGVGKRVAIITNNKSDIDFIHEEQKAKDVFVLYSDFNNMEQLRKSNIQKSSIVFVNLDNDTEKLVYILSLKKAFPNLEYVVTLDNGDLKNTFISAGVTNTISKHEISSKLLASYMFEPDVANYSESIMSFADEDSDYDIKQFFVTTSNPYLGKAYQEAFYDLKRRYNAVLIGITKRDKFGNKKLIKNPLGDLKISTGDYLIILLNGKSFKLVRKIFGVDEGLIREK
ncbi:TrkA family potassium uptake protein [Marinoscillum sp. MHG1-6]|uniref:potassium channel family protein n=1 Tax=Marinoscillum sp. MHG1-6 TaxID=2959627 RepID=UPI00215724DE|nr:potassium channel protein [Marinoscillum sp. MHG1-6]